MKISFKRAPTVCVQADIPIPFPSRETMRLGSGMVRFEPNAGIQTVQTGFPLLRLRQIPVSSMNEWRAARPLEDTAETPRGPYRHANDRPRRPRHRLSSIPLTKGAPPLRYLLQNS